MSNVKISQSDLLPVRRDGQIIGSGGSFSTSSAGGGTGGGGGLAGVWWSGNTLHIDGNVAAALDVVAFTTGYTGTTLWSSMPIASATVLGGVKIGSGLAISSGVLSTTGSTGGGTWGSITGTLSAQTDLQVCLNGKLASGGTAVCATTAGNALSLGGNLANTYAPLASPVFTTCATLPTPFKIGTISMTATGTELNYVAGVTSAIQTQLNGKLGTSACAADSALLGTHSASYFQTALTNPIIGTGTANYLPKFCAASTLTNSSIYDCGNVGIGTTTPSQQLTIQNGAINTMIYLHADNGGNPHAHLTLFASEPAKTYNGVGISNNWYWNGSAWARNDTSVGGSYIAMREEQINFYTVSSAGSDSNRLVLGASGVQVYQNLCVNGEVTAYYSSDERLKCNIKEFKATELISKIQPVTFNWNDIGKSLNSIKDDRLNYGIIAQQIETLLPSLIHPVYSDYKGIDYIQLVPILLQAVKELAVKINKLDLDFNYYRNI